MRPVLRVEILPIGEYEAVRPEFRGRIIEMKRARRVALGPDMSAVFENRDTVQLQIQEMLRTERITAESAVLHEVNTYNELVPGDDEVSLTLFVEIAEKERRDTMLVELAGLEDAIYVEIDGARFPARGKREGASPGRTTAVHYLKAKLSKAAVAALRAGTAKAALVADHPRYRARGELGPDALKQLAADFAA
ncbi:MAG TPA: DUF3501 family protein [Minicystis sp.]|nr:DUF3501 family protein [Minicystis sp.]